MKKIFLTGLFSLGLMASAFAGTITLLPAEDCNASTECSSTNGKGCRVTGCSYGSTEHGYQIVTCNYEKCDGPVPAATPQL